MNKLFILALIALFAVLTQQYYIDDGEDFSHYRFRIPKVKIPSGRTLSRTGHAISGGVRAADTIRNWFR